MIIGHTLLEKRVTSEAVEGTGVTRRRFSASWHVKTNKDPTIDVLDVLDYCDRQPGLPTHGTPWSSLSRTDAAVAVRMSVEPKRDKPHDWIVRVEYEPPSAEQRRDASGELTDDPLAWIDEVEVDDDPEPAPVEAARYVSGYSGTAHSFLAGLPDSRLGPVCNSAMTAMDPPPETERMRTLYRITTYMPSFDGSTNAWRQAINNQTYRLVKPFYALDVEFEPYTLRVLRRRTQFAYSNKIPHWRITWELLHDPRGWRKEYLDQGVDRRAWPGDPDGVGGTVSSTLPTAGARTRRIRDAKGNALSSPIPFNGDGQPLSHNTNPVYAKWIIWPNERSFADAPWHDRLPLTAPL